MTRPTLDAALRDLDPAHATALTEAERERADATLARILATPAREPAAEPRGRPRRRRRRLLVPVALAGVLGVAGPSLLGGSAFGSWTSTPETLTGSARAEAAATCRASFGVTDRAQQVVIADRRGEWTYVLLTGARAELSCLMDEDLVGRRGATGDVGFMGSYGQGAGRTPDVSRSGIKGYGGVGAMPVDGWWPFTDDEEWINQVEGFVGVDVTGVTVHTRAGTDVEASVAGGRFAAWWPAPKPSSEHPDSDGVSTYTVTLVDGTTREVSG